jgi:hypothetical protein
MGTMAEHARPPWKIDVDENPRPRLPYSKATFFTPLAILEAAYF